MVTARTKAKPHTKTVAPVPDATPSAPGTADPKTSHAQAARKAAMLKLTHRSGADAGGEPAPEPRPPAAEVIPVLLGGTILARVIAGRLNVMVGGIHRSETTGALVLLDEAAADRALGFGIIELVEA